MASLRWRLFDERLTFRREIDRLFSIFFGTESRVLANGDLMPDVDLSEIDDEIVIRMNVPTMEQGDNKVSMFGDYLTVFGERKKGKEKEKKYYFSLQRKLKTFGRTIPITIAENANSISAEYEKCTESSFSDYTRNKAESDTNNIQKALPSCDFQMG